MTRQMISIVFILAILSIFSCDGPVIEIDPNHQSCEIDSDCVKVGIQCACHCGSAVNAQYKQIYLDIRREVCAGYNGPLCMMVCEVAPACIENQCVLKDLSI